MTLLSASRACAIADIIDGYDDTITSANESEHDKRRRLSAELADQIDLHLAAARRRIAEHRAKLDALLAKMATDRD